MSLEKYRSRLQALQRLLPKDPDKAAKALWTTACAIKDSVPGHPDSPAKKQSKEEFDLFMHEAKKRILGIYRPPPIPPPSKKAYKIIEKFKADQTQ